MRCLVHASSCALLLLAVPGQGPLRPMDVFELEHADDPQISPDGTAVVYVRKGFDVMKDKARTALWLCRDGEHRALTDGTQNASRPRWSPDGNKIVYSVAGAGPAQLFVRWMDTGQVSQLTRGTQAPGACAWSPDGEWLAFSMFVPKARKPFVSLPKPPKGATWAAPAKVITKVRYRADGRGYLPDGRRHLFVLPADGGTPRQVTTGDFDHGGTPAWSPDGKQLVFSANRRPDADRERNTELYSVRLRDGAITQLTDRQGPDDNPVVSRHGMIAWTGYDDRLQGYQIARLYVMPLDRSRPPFCCTKDLDRSVRSPAWRADGSGVFFLHDDNGRTHLSLYDLTGKIETLVRDVGGTTLGRPYASGSFSVSREDVNFAYTRGSTQRPADVAVWQHGKVVQRTHLNRDLLGHRDLGTVEELWWQSSHDQRRIQGWLVKPPGFDPKQKYPFVLEIHGGPFANYGFRFSAEVQLYAARGYVVLYANPRGSSGYGAEFGNLIHHNYPSRDYDDLMSGVDAVLAKGFVDQKKLFVTGGSGGGVLTSWIVGKTKRFAAAVVAKPVINWYSFVLTADSYPFFTKYWFPGPPWEHTEHYMKRSPISLVGNVTTPTMLLTGEADYRTPIGESEQYFQALQLRKVKTALVRIPGASHGIAARPSHLIAKVAHILEWFRRHGGR